MNIGAIKSVSLTAVLPVKDPPWGAEDMSKLKLLMDQGLSDAEIARELGATINDVSQQVAALAASASDTSHASGSPSAGKTNPLLGNNVNIKA
ncbi:MAG: hypothetical protein P4L43_04645 [Syntrophobacteraceae bacterium]|nr:hypothetical protein [Syntrophobacteraceae bacterium]